MILHLKLNGDATDASGNGHHGTPIDITFGQWDERQGAYFDGSACVELPASNIVVPKKDSWTIALWFNRESSSVYRRLFSLHRGESAGSGVYVNASGTGLAVGIHNGSSIPDRVITTGLSPNTWYHIALTYDGTAARAYLGGILIATITTAFVGCGSYPAILGDYDGNMSAAYAIVGKEDDVRIYSGVATPEEIKAIYNFGDGTEVADPLIATGIYPVLKPSIVRGVSE